MCEFILILFLLRSTCGASFLGNGGVFVGIGVWILIHRIFCICGWRALRGRILPGRFLRQSQLSSMHPTSNPTNNNYIQSTNYHNNIPPLIPIHHLKSTTTYPYPFPQQYNHPNPKFQITITITQSHLQLRRRTGDILRIIQVPYLITVAVVSPLDYLGAVFFYALV